VNHVSRKEVIPARLPLARILVKAIARLRRHEMFVEVKQASPARLLKLLYRPLRRDDLCDGLDPALPLLHVRCVGLGVHDEQVAVIATHQDHQFGSETDVVEVGGTVVTALFQDEVMVVACKRFLDGLALVGDDGPLVFDPAGLLLGEVLLDVFVFVEEFVGIVEAVFKLAPLFQC
jgi:hypothetical protein